MCLKAVWSSKGRTPILSSSASWVKELKPKSLWVRTKRMKISSDWNEKKQHCWDCRQIKPAAVDRETCFPHCHAAAAKMPYLLSLEWYCLLTNAIQAHFAIFTYYWVYPTTKWPSPHYSIQSLLNPPTFPNPASETASNPELIPALFRPSWLFWRELKFYKRHFIFPFPVVPTLPLERLPSLLTNVVNGLQNPSR